MKYPDNTNSVNGFNVGKSVSTRTADLLAPSDDGLDYLRDGTDHVGTIAGDALNTVTLSYDVNGGEGETPPDETVNFGSSVTVAEYPDEVIAWNDKADGTGDDYAPGISTFISEDLMLYAQYE